MNIVALAILLVQLWNSIKAIPQVFSKKSYQKMQEKLIVTIGNLYSKYDEESFEIVDICVSIFILFINLVCCILAIFVGTRFQRTWFILLVVYQVIHQIWCGSKVPAILKCARNNTLMEKFPHKRVTNIIGMILDLIYYITSITFLLGVPLWQ